MLIFCPAKRLGDSLATILACKHCVLNMLTWFDKGSVSVTLVPLISVWILTAGCLVCSSIGTAATAQPQQSVS